MRAGGWRGLCLILALGLWATAGRGRDITLCMTEREFLPVNSTRIEAPGQYLVRRAIEGQGDKAVFLPLPWRRCVEGLRHGDYDGAIGMAATEGFFPFMRFPVTDGHPDISKGIGDLLFIVIRLKDSPADWDGEHFLNLRKPVIYNAPSLLVHDKMRGMGGGNPNTSLSEKQMMTMLVAGRADIAIGRKDVAQDLIAEDDSFRDRVEILPIPFISAPSYLSFRQDFIEPSPGYMERVWDAIGRQKAAPDWPETEQRLLAAHKPRKPS